MMKWLRSVFVVGVASLARMLPSYRISEAGGGWLFGGRQSKAGTAVDETESLSLSAVFAALQLLSRVIGSLPRHVYKQSGDSQQIMSGHPVARLLGTRANPEMSAAVYSRTMEFHRLLFGNAYAEIQWAGDGTPVALWPVEPWRVRPKRDEGGSLYYRIDDKRDVSPDDMIHQTLFSWDGVCGRSFIDHAIESLGLGLATQVFAARYFGGGSRPGGVLTKAGSSTPEQRKEMRQGWEQRHGGPGKAHGTAVLWDGWTYTPEPTDDAQAAQLLESRRYTVEEVARWFNIPPHLLRDLSRSTNNNIESQGIDFIVYSIGPTLVEVEQEYDHKLLRDEDGLSVRHDVAALQRGDAAARSALYSSLFNVGAITENEIRKREGLNPVEGGNTLFVPVNMVPLEQALKPKPDPVPAPAFGQKPAGDQKPDPAEADPAEPEPPAKQSAPAATSPLAPMRALLAATLRRMAAVEGNAVRRAADHPGEFLARVEGLYAKHPKTLAEALAPVLDAAFTMGLETRFTEHLADEWCKASKQSVIEASGEASAATLSVRVASLLDGWESRAEEFAAVSIRA